MKKIYAFLAAATLASGVSAATLEKAPRLSMENATLVGRIENVAQKKVADRSKVALSRAESEAPVVTGNYLICYDAYNSKADYSTTRMAPSNNLVATETEGEYQFETFIFSDTSMKGKLHYEPEFWKDENGNPEGEWVLSIPVGDKASEPLFYTDLSEFSTYGFTNNEPIYFYFAGPDDNGNITYYAGMTSYDFVVRDGLLLSPYIDGVGLIMCSRYIDNVAVTYNPSYLDLFIALPNAHGTTKESARDENGEIVTEEFEFPMYTETGVIEGEPCLYVKGMCGWPGDQLFLLNQEEKYAYTVEMPLTVIQGYELYMSQDLETTEVFLDVTPENTGKTVLSTDFIGLIDAADVSGGLFAAYENVVITLDYNVWTGEGEAGIKAPAVDNSNAPAVYYNLQGMEISNPAAGQMYIVKQGNKVSKQIIK